MRALLAPALLAIAIVCSGALPTISNEPANAATQEITLDAEAQRRIERAVAALVPEYNQRLARDGEASANDWIRQKAFELGQREADLMKQRLGLD